MDAGIVDLVINLWKRCINVNQINEWKSIHADMQECMYQLLMALWFICSGTKQNQERMYPEFLEFIVKVVTGKTFSGRMKKDRRVQDCYKSMLGIVYQFVVKMHSSHQLLYNYNAATCLQKTLNGQNTRNIKSRAALILAYILTDEQQKQTDSDTAVEFLLSLLQSCVDTQDKRVQDFNYSSLEILEGTKKHGNQTWIGFMGCCYYY